MAYSRTYTVSTLVLSVIFLFIVVLTTGIHFKRDKPSGEDTVASLQFNVKDNGPVGMYYHNTTSYDPTTPEGSEALERLLPSGGHVVHISDSTSSKKGLLETKVYTVALFHRLKCLEIIGKAYVSFEQPLSPIVTHCMNYLRQSVLCRLDLRLESVKDPQGFIEEGGYDAKCNDWNAVYEEAERNHKEYLRLFRN